MVEFFFSPIPFGSVCHRTLVFALSPLQTKERMDDWEDVAASLPEYQQSLVYEYTLPESLAERDRRNRNVGYEAGLKACKITVEQLEWELARAQERVESLALALEAQRRRVEVLAKEPGNGPPSFDALDEWALKTGRGRLRVFERESHA